jgi:hypothetical protein
MLTRFLYMLRASRHIRRIRNRRVGAALYIGERGKAIPGPSPSAVCLSAYIFAAFPSGIGSFPLLASLGVSSTRLRRRVNAPRASVYGGTDVLAVHDGLPPGLSTADNEAGWQSSLAELAALVEAG